MKKLTHSSLFWFSATLISGLLYIFSFHFFPQTFPLINLNITMDREVAVADAKTIAEKLHLGPEQYQQATTFHTDAITKTFVELEAGGKDAFVNMMHNNLYQPYTWQVRHFKEFEKNETLIIFTPDGKPYSFNETISEDLPGAQLSEEQAEIIAQEHAANKWNIIFADYKRVEASQKEQPSKRIDHTFVYERINEVIGEGFYRLNICVSGDKVTQVMHSVKIPETFYRRYTQMRSANNSIAWAALLLIGLLYILGGCGLGLSLMFKKRWTIWKQPIMWGVVLAACQTFATLNQLPSLWMYYQSALATHSYLLQIILGCISTFIFQTGALTVIIMTAESLTRYAFGHHPQFWSLWLSHNAATYAVLCRTYFSYILISLLCAFVIIFYFFSTRYLHWWIPSDVLFNPNILSTYVPWFSPIAQSLNAGFMEECLFRAIPLAGAAIIGSHYGKRNLFVMIAFVLQAFIFGAAHANYPTQPAYGRLIELIVPSFIFGFAYLRYGLLPSIITHVVYDLIWFSLPLFTSTSPSAWLNKIMIIVMGLLPLIIIAYARFKHGKWNQFEEEHRNKTWQPTEIVETEKEYIVTSPTTDISPKTQKSILCAALIGIALWLWATPFKHDGITITDTQQNAIIKTDELLKQKQITLSDTWHTMPLFFTHYTQIPSLTMQHLFIWKEGKKELYHQLLNTYLQPAHWTVRYAQFEGDLIQRAEEYKIMLYDKTRFYHQLPESTEGSSLSKDQARELAHKELQTHFQVNPVDLTEISAQEHQLPHRKNWTFTFADIHNYPLEKGQPRIIVVISGNEVIDSARIIHVPELWERDEQNAMHKISIISLIIFLLCFFIAFTMLFFAHKSGLTFSFSSTLFGLIFVILMSLYTIDLLNTWPSIIGAFNTSEPWNNQLFQRFGGLFFRTLIQTLSTALLISICCRQQKKAALLNCSVRTIMLGYGTGIIIAALYALADTIMPCMQPLWPDYHPLGTAIPIVGGLIQCIINYIRSTAHYTFMFIVINQATSYWQKKRVLCGLFFIVCGFLSPLPAIKALPFWIVASIMRGITLLCVYRYIIRYNIKLIPLITAAISIAHIIQQGVFNAYPGACVATVINVCVITGLSLFWFKKLQK